jgi:hypothetical protein
MKYRKTIKPIVKPRSLYACSGCGAVYYKKKDAAKCCSRGTVEIILSDRVVMRLPTFNRDRRVVKRRKQNDNA